MQANPNETCLSAAMKLNIHRKRISKLLTIANNLPENFITELVPKTLCQMTLNRLFDLAIYNQASK
jgi:hypothetical protein